MARDLGLEPCRAVIWRGYRVLPASVGVVAAGTRRAGSFPALEATPLGWGKERLEQLADPLLLGASRGHRVRHPLQ